jgi:hypothetical protein
MASLVLVFWSDFMSAGWSGLVVVFLCLSPPLGAAEVKPPEPPKAFQVPYRLSATQHVIVRAKINGKGPYNFLLDTGAPTLYVSTALCRQLGIKPDKKGWGTFDRFDIEGGASIPKARGRIEDPFQLEGMNGMGLAGVHLHGVIGYTILARYRLVFDFTKDKMTWTPLAFDPPAPAAIGSGAPAGMEVIGTAMKTLGSLLGKKPSPPPVPRGFLGLELADADGRVTVKAVLAGSPAAAGGVKAGDRLTHFQGAAVKTRGDVYKLAAKHSSGEMVALTLERDGKPMVIEVKLGEGL